MDVLKRGERMKARILFALYAIQGTSFGFQSMCLPFILRQQGLSMGDLGAMKFVYIPWILKPIVASRVERYAYFWLQSSIYILGALSLIPIALSPSNVFALSSVLVALNLFSAINDICVDCLAIKLLKSNELGFGNTIQVVAYKLGAIFIGGVLYHTYNALGWNCMLVCLALYYFTSAIVFTYIGRDLLKPVLEPKEADTTTRPVGWKDLYSIPGTPWILLYILCYKLSDSSGVFSIYLFDKFTDKGLVSLGNIVTRISSIAGSIWSGYKLASTAPLVIISRIARLQLIPILLQTVLAYVWTSGESVSLCLFGFLTQFMNLFCVGALTTVVFTLMMRLSKEAPIDAQGLHFSFLCSCEIMGKLLFASGVGQFVDYASFPPAFVGFSIFGLLLIVVISRAPMSIRNWN